jgi:hypothetical protein
MVAVRSEKRRRRLFDDAAGYVDRFGLLLLIAGVAVLTMSLVDLKEGVQDWQAEVGTILVSVFVGATLLLSLRASGVTRRYRVIADVVVSLGVLITVVVVLVEGFSTRSTAGAGLATPSIAWIVLSMGAPVVVVRRLIHHERANRQTLLGAVSAYLLIAMAFNFVFLSLDAYGSKPFFGTAEPTTSFMYFSLVTITTLGFGDLAAAEPLGRMLSTVEAVIGQVYLVTFVAMIVGLIVGQRQGADRSE